MQIIGVRAPGAPTTVSFSVEHGANPRVTLWERGYILTRLLRATRSDDGELLVTVQVATKQPGAVPPKSRDHGVREDLVIEPGEEIVKYQRIAAYAVVRSARGILGTMCSAQTSVPGAWQLPGGGLDTWETPSECVIREVREETDQKINIRRILELQSDHWIGRGPSGRVEDFHALRIYYAADCPNPTDPTVLDVGGTTSRSQWLSPHNWRSLPWTSGSRAMLEKYLRTAPRGLR